MIITLNLDAILNLAPHAEYLRVGDKTIVDVPKNRVLLGASKVVIRRATDECFYVSSYEDIV